MVTFITVYAKHCFSPVQVQILFHHCSASVLQLVIGFIWSYNEWPKYREWNKLWLCWVRSWQRQQAREARDVILFHLSPHHMSGYLPLLYWQLWIKNGAVIGAPCWQNQSKHIILHFLSCLSRALSIALEESLKVSTISSSRQRVERSFWHSWTSLEGKREIFTGFAFEWLHSFRPTASNIHDAKLWISV